MYEYCRSQIPPPSRLFSLLSLSPLPPSFFFERLKRNWTDKNCCLADEEDSYILRVFTEIYELMCAYKYSKLCQWCAHTSTANSVSDVRIQVPQILSVTCAYKYSKFCQWCAHTSTANSVGDVRIQVQQILSVLCAYKYRKFCQWCAHRSTANSVRNAQDFTGFSVLVCFRTYLPDDYLIQVETFTKT